ncbi:Dos2-interacting transcription regulator of RNA-Pol-II-domain-containing protein [Syncephalis plumigaleata]|nr:Dos2-interacting transcription regulator of RNA-Pol-II-domain-containing protein [Syncephalis plumigaleata]
MTVAQAISTYWLQGRTAEAVEDIVIAVNTEEKNSILEVVQALQPQLTSEQKEERIQGIELLNVILEKCDTHRVTTSIVRVLVAFYTDRLASDDPCVPAILNGLLVFERFSPIIDNEQIVQIATAVLQLNVQRYSQTTRYTVFRLIEWLINSHATVLDTTTSSLDVVGGFIQVMDGEKDPRNLLLAFSVAQRLIQQFDVTKHVEDLFEILFCYFPITFRPPPHDPYNITADDLKLALRQSLAATPLFGSMALPMLLRNCHLVWVVPRCIGYHNHCAPVYGVTLLMEHFDTLWRLVQSEIFAAADDSVTKSALSTLRSIAMVMSQLDDANTTPFDTLLNTVLTCIKRELDKAPSATNESGATGMRTRYKPISIVLTCPPIALLLERLSQALMPTILIKYNTADQPVTRKRSYLLLLEAFLEADISDEITQHIMPATALLPYKDDMMRLFGTAYTSTAEYDQLRRTGLQGIRQLLFLSGLLLPNEAGILVQQIIHVVIEQLNTPEEELSELRLDSVGLLAEYAMQRPMVVKDVVFPPCISQLSKAIDLAATMTPMEHVPFLVQSKIQIALQVMSACAVTTLLFEDVLLQWLDIIDHLETAQVTDQPSNDTNNSNGGTINQWLLHHLLQSILGVYQAADEMTTAQPDQSPIVISPTFYTTMLTFLWSKAIEPTLSTNKIHSIFINNEIITVIARLLGEGIRQLNEHQQQIPVELAIKLYTQGDLSHLSCSSKEDSIPFTPLQRNAPIPQQNTLPLFATILNHCRPKTIIPINDMVAFLLDLLQFGCDEHTVSIASHAMAQIRLAALQFLIWSTRALALLAHPLARDTTQLLIECFTDKELAKEAAHGFSTITMASSRKDQMSTTTSHPMDPHSFMTTKLLNRQKFFMYALPMITQGFNDANEDIKVYYLMALSHLLSNVPKQIMLDALPPLVPLLIQSLSIPEDTSLKQSTLTVFSLMVKEAPHLVAEHIGTLIDQALLLSEIHQTSQSTMMIRISALQFLALIPVHIRYHLLHPIKPRVLRVLARAVDDPKRSVRKEAVLCRHHWITLSAK